MNTLIWTKNNSLPKKICRSLVGKFDKSCDKFPGLTAPGYTPEVKNTLDLPISGHPDFTEEDGVIYASLSKAFQEYRELNASLVGFYTQGIRDLGYHIQMYPVGGLYDWHHDEVYEPNLKAHRFLTFLWYLNDVGEGGETEFSTGEKIKPEEGKILLFPSTWTYTHRSLTNKDRPKYILIGWLYHFI